MFLGGRALHMTSGVSGCLTESNFLLRLWFDAETTFFRTIQAPFQACKIIVQYLLVSGRMGSIWFAFGCILRV